jgi:uncharacterized ubiquitin-like protein YukD
MKLYGYKIVTLVKLAKKTNNMPMLYFTVEQLYKFRMAIPQHFQNKISLNDAINSLYYIVTEDETLNGEKLEKKFIRIMNNWKDAKKIENLKKERIKKNIHN